MILHIFPDVGFKPSNGRQVQQCLYSDFPVLNSQKQNQRLRLFKLFYIFRCQSVGMLMKLTSKEDFCCFVVFAEVVNIFLQISLLKL